MRWALLVMIAGCGFSVGTNATPNDSSGPGDTRGSDGDAMLIDGPGSDAMSPDAPLARVTYVQGTSTVGMNAAVAVQLTQAVEQGDLCVIGIGAQGSTIKSIGDTHNNSYSPVTMLGGQVVYVAPNMNASAGTTIAIAFNSNAGYTVAVAIYRGLAKTNPIDASTAAAAMGDSLDSGAITTTHAHDLLVGVAASNGNIAAGTGNTPRTTGNISLIQDREVTTTDSYRMLAATQPNVTWTMSILALKAND